MKRLFTFGCSFTRYHWPTWADIMSQDYDHFQNWGRIGGGNHFIFYSLIECINRHEISRDDTVAIMWTSPAREDRWIDGKWKTHGSVYNSGFSKEYIDHHTDPVGYYIMSLSLIDAAYKILSSMGCKFHFFQMVPMEMIDDVHLDFKKLKSNPVIKSAQKLFSKSLFHLTPSVYEIIFQKNWTSRNHIVIPKASADAKKTFNERYDEVKGPDWPSFLDYFNDATSSTTDGIINEIDFDFDFAQWKRRIKHSRIDQHPTPGEHFEYLDRVGIKLTDRAKKFADHWNQTVLSDIELNWKSEQVDRI